VERKEQEEDRGGSLWERRFLALARILGASQEDIRRAFEEAPSEEKEVLREFLSPDSENFMGSGLNLQEFLALGMVGRLRRSYANQSRKEQKRRLELILRLSRALDEIKRVSSFGTRWGEMVIEGIVTGDESILRRWDQTFELIFRGVEDKELFQNLWAPFNEIVKEEQSK
jgi:hypothetical protein